MWKVEEVLRGSVKPWFLEVEASLRIGIEKTTSRSFGVKSEHKRSVLLKGPTAPKGVRVVWVNCFRTGKATITIDGVEAFLPFEFLEDFDLLPEEVK